MSGASGNVRAGRAFVELMLDQTKLERGLKAAQAKLRNFGNSMTSVGKNLVTVATLAAAPLAYSTKTFADFDDQMRMVKAVTGATEQQFKSLTEVAERLGRTTSFTAKQVAEGMTALGRMGFSPDEIEAAIPAVLNLSRATGTELGEAAEIAANNMRVFGIESSKMANVADILTATANGSAQTLTDLSEGLKMAGPQAAAAGDSITNVSAALGVLANMGIKGSLAGTALRKAYSQFANTKIQAKLKAMGIATTDANGNLRAMPDIMAEIAKAMAAMPTAQRLGFAEEIFDLRGSLAGLQLGGNIQQLDEFIRKLQGVNGTAAKTAEEMDSGIGGAFRIFMSAVEGCQIAIGRIIGEALGPYIKRMSDVLTKVAEWIAAHKGVVIMAVKIVAGMLAAGAALIALGLAFKAVAFAVGTLSTVFTVLKVAVLAPIAAVKGLMAIFTALKAVMIGVKVVAIAMWTAISSPAVLVGVALGALIAVVWKLTGAWDICADSVKGMASDFKRAFAGIKEVVGKTWEVIKIALASGDLAGAAKVGLSALKVVWLQGIFPIKKAWYGLSNFLSDSWTIIIFSILKGAYHFWYGMLYGFKYLWNCILKVWYPLVNFLDDSWAVVSTSILKLGNNLWYGLLYGLKYIGNAMQKAWNYIWDGIVTAFEKTVLEIQKAWIRTKGLFDSEEEVNAEIAVVEREYQRRRDARRRQSSAAERQSQRELDALNAEWTAANKSLDDAMIAKINQNKARADAGLAEANAPIDTTEWDSTIKGVEDAMVGEIAENQQKYNQAVGEAAAEINAAKAEWQGAMDEVRQRAAEKAAAVEADQERANAAAAQTEQAAAGLSSTSGKAVGAWSAEELDALLGGGGSAQERTAKATEAIVANTKETNRQLKRMKSGTAPATLSYN